jgi:hypothetical protein
MANRDFPHPKPLLSRGKAIFWFFRISSRLEYCTKMSDLAEESEAFRLSRLPSLEGYL